MLPVNPVDNRLHIINLLPAFNLQPGEVDEEDVLLLIKNEPFTHVRFMHRGRHRPSGGPARRLRTTRRRSNASRPAPLLSRPPDLLLWHMTAAAGERV